MTQREREKKHNFVMVLGTENQVIAQISMQKNHFLIR